MGFYYYIGPYVKRGWIPKAPEADLFFAAPDGAIGSLDLRVDPTQNGNALFVFKDIYDAKGYVALNTGKPMAEEPCGEAAVILRDLYGVDLDNDGTLLRGLWEMLTAHADGVNVVNPLMPTHKGVMELWLANECVHSQPWQGKADTAWPQVQRVLAANYTAMRADAVASKGGDTTLAQKWLGAMELKYRVPYTDIAPVALQDVAPIKPTTTLTESFTASDGDALTGDLSWTEVAGDWDIVSNRARVGASSTRSVARAEHDLSSDDHYCEVTVTAVGSGSSTVLVGPCVRFKSDAQTNYYCAPYQEFDQLRTAKNVAGTITILGTTPAITIYVPESYKLEADGTTLKSYQAGTLRETITDNSISSYTRVGIIGYTSSGIAECDTLVAADLVAGVSLPAILAANMRGGFGNSRGGFVN